MHSLPSRCAALFGRGVLLRLALAALLAAAFVAAAAAAAGSSTASAARACSPPRYPGVGYFTSLQVSGGASCASGSRVALAYYRCRVHSGGAKGRCHSRIYSFSCTERRNSIPTEIDARVTCRHGRQAVIHTYQQTT